MFFRLRCRSRRYWSGSRFYFILPCALLKLLSGLIDGMTLLSVPAWVGEIDRIVGYIRISVPCLWISRARYDQIWLDEAADGGVVHAGLVIHQAQAGEQALAGVAEVGLADAAQAAAHLSEGQVALLGQGAVRGDAGHGGALLVGQEVAQPGAGAAVRAGAAVHDRLAAYGVVFLPGGLRAVRGNRGFEGAALARPDRFSAR